MLAGFPPRRRAAEAARGAAARRDARVGAAAADAGARRSRASCSAPTARAAWLYGAAMHGDVPAGRRRAARSPPRTSTSWATPSAGRARRAAPPGWPPRSPGYLRGARRPDAHGRAGGARSPSSAGASPASSSRAASACRRRSSSPTSRRTRCCALAGDALDGRLRRRAAPLPLGPGDAEGRLGAVRARAVDGAGGARGRAPCTSAAPRRRCSSASRPRAGLAERPFLLFGQQSVADPTRAPAGQHTAWAYTHGPQEADWERETERHVERVEAQIERFAPGLPRPHPRPPRAVARRPAAPQRRTSSAATSAPAPTRSTRRSSGRVPSLSPYRTPVRGLYLGSAATFPGGAVHGVPGHAAARVALLEQRVLSRPCGRGTEATQRRRGRRNV